MATVADLVADINDYVVEDGDGKEGAFGKAVGGASRALLQLKAVKTTVTRVKKELLAQLGEEESESRDEYLDDHFVRHFLDAKEFLVAGKRSKTRGVE
jgi:hypothetical protein